MFTDTIILSAIFFSVKRLHRELFGLARPTNPLIFISQFIFLSEYFLLIFEKFSSNSLSVISNWLKYFRTSPPSASNLRAAHVPLSRPARCRNPAEDSRRINDCVASIRERRKNVNRRYLCDTRGTRCVQPAAPAPVLTSF